MEEFLKLWPVLHGEQGLVAAVAAWRGVIAVTVPLFNMKLQAWFTKLLVENPMVANSIVANKTYKAFALVLVMTIGVRLPSETSMLLHEVKENIKNDSNPAVFKRSVESANDLKPENETPKEP